MGQLTLFSFIWRFIKPNRWLFFLLLIFSLTWSLDATLWPYLLKLVIDVLSRCDIPRTLAWASLKYPVFAGLALWILIEFGFRMQGYLLASLLPKIEADIRISMFDHIQRHSPKYFHEHFAGSLSNKITDMTTQVTVLLLQVLTVFIPAFAGCILAILFFFNINTFFAIILTIWILVHLSICLFFSRKCANLAHQHAETRSTLLGKIVDSLSNHFAVNLFYRFRHEKSYIAKFQLQEKKQNYFAKRYIEHMRLTLGIFTFLGAGIGINGLMFLFWINNKISTGEVAQLFNTTWNITMILWMASVSIPELLQAIGIARQALTVMAEPQDVVDVPKAKSLVVTKGEIVFDNVSFQYSNKKLFQNKHVVIAAGEKVGLVGYSGAGKSTFVSLILRFYPIGKGKILIDGQDISTVTIKSLRNQVSLIPQDPQLFHRSLKENILYGRQEATDEEMIRAAQWAHCDEFIQRLPQGYQTLVGEKGSKLSGGERQRIAIARAILANAPILILDEATSSLDSVTENYIQESLDELMHNKTSIVIAHRLSTLAKMDRILVFDEGKIVEEGAHQELLTDGGHYAKMWQMQAGGFLPDNPDEE